MFKKIALVALTLSYLSLSVALAEGVQASAQKVVGSDEQNITTNSYTPVLDPGDGPTENKKCFRVALLGNPCIDNKWGW